MEIVITRKKIKNTYIKIKDQVVYVVAPKKLPNEYINRLLFEKESWIKEKLGEQKAKISLVREFSKEDYQNAYNLFKNRLEYYLELFQESIVKFHVKDMKARWGSCNKARKVINLNVKLLLVDQDALDYVVAHEIAHLKYADHSKNYYSHLASVMPNHNELRKKLANYKLR